MLYGLGLVGIAVILVTALSIGTFTISSEKENVLK